MQSYTFFSKKSRQVPKTFSHYLSISANNTILYVIQPPKLTQPIHSFQFSFITYPQLSPFVNFKSS